MSLVRVQEWFADRLPGVQYPRIQRLQVAPAKPRLDLLTRVGLALVGVWLLVVGVLGAAFCLFLLYIILSSVF